MNQNERLNYLINYLLEDLHLDKDLFFGEDLFTTYRKLVNIREAKPVSKKFLEIQDEMLQEENRKKGIVSFENDNNKIILWKGDITRLKVDAIVNAANNQMEGCFVPGHHCIDNAIHTYAGIQLREKCHQIMKQQGILEPTGKAKITLAYNLPSCYVIHTVGPIWNGGRDREEELLANCYFNSMKLAMDNGIRSIAFPSISTGIYSFPVELAAKIAVHTVNRFLQDNPDCFDLVEWVLFDTHTESVYEDEVDKIY